MVHGSPSPDGVLAAVKRPEPRSVVFVPLMITNSEHISKDVLGEKETSWRSRLGLPYRLGPLLLPASPIPAVRNLLHPAPPNIVLHDPIRLDGTSPAEINAPRPRTVMVSPQLTS